MKSNRWLISAIGLFFFSTFHIIFARQSSLTENAAGARSLAMGQAAMASGNDALSSAINPANASTLQSLTASAYHSDFSSTGTINAFGMILPFPKHGVFLGVSLYHYGISDIPAVGANGELIDTYGFSEDHLLLTYAKRFSPQLSIGFNAKFVRQAFANNIAGPENAGIDIGAQYSFHHKNAILHNLILGFTVDNLIQPTLTPGKEKQYLPREVRILLEKNLNVGRSNLLFVSNVRFTDASFVKGRTFHFGAEYAYRSLLYVRAGIGLHSAPG